MRAAGKVPVESERRGTRGRRLTSIELCAGAGGQALGLEQAGFEHLALVEIDADACTTLRINRPHWNTLQMDVRAFDAAAYGEVDLLAAGPPCPPFSVAGQRLGRSDERDMIPHVLEVVTQCRPRALLIENVRGILDPLFDGYRAWLDEQLIAAGYRAYGWQLLNARDFGVPQLRPRALCVAIRASEPHAFSWPKPTDEGQTVGAVLHDAMAERGWRGAAAWAKKANGIAPTLVGGSKKHGGPDLGPTRAKRAWAALGVNAHSIAEIPPDRDFTGMPRLTVTMAAAIQGFPPSWTFSGRKTAAYRQVGNAFPPPVARAIGESIKDALTSGRRAAAAASA